MKVAAIDDPTEEIGEHSSKKGLYESKHCRIVSIDNKVEA